MHFQHSDGGRKAAGYKGETRDCVTRALAIALELPYAYVYDTLTHACVSHGSARTGVRRVVYESFLRERGWTFTPTMSIGSGCCVHLRADELPAGRLIARLSRHLCAVVDGVAYDTHDPRRGGTRCVYGYYRASE